MLQIEKVWHLFSTLLWQSNYSNTLQSPNALLGKTNTNQVWLCTTAQRTSQSCICHFYIMELICVANTAAIHNSLQFLLSGVFMVLHLSHTVVHLLFCSLPAYCSVLDHGPEETTFCSSVYKLYRGITKKTFHLTWLWLVHTFKKYLFTAGCIRKSLLNLYEDYKEKSKA